MVALLKDRQYPVYDKNGKVLRLGGWGEYMGLTRWGFINVIPEPERPHHRDEVDWDFVVQLSDYPNKLVALGELSSVVLGRLGMSHFKLPHPSGLNRQNNDLEFVRRRLDECKVWIES